jgi:hypothetical protein
MTPDRHNEGVGTAHPTLLGCFKVRAVMGEIGTAL